MISDASQISALQTAVDIASGRVKLNASQRELFAAQIESIRRRIIDAAAKRNAPASLSRRQSENAE